MTMSYSAAALLAGVFVIACDRGQPPTAVPASRDEAFRQLVANILDDRYRRHPTEATDLGLHQFDAQLEDRTPEAIASEVAALKAFRSQLVAFDQAALGETNALDREHLIHAMDEGIDRKSTR